MTNSQMIENRFYLWHNYRKLISNIKATLAADGEVHIVGYGKVIACTAKHIEMFKATKSGAYVRRGKNWDCINFSKIVHYRRITA